MCPVQCCAGGPQVKGKTGGKPDPKWDMRWKKMKVDLTGCPAKTLSNVIHVCENSKQNISVWRKTSENHGACCLWQQCHVRVTLFYDQAEAYSNICSGLNECVSGKLQSHYRTHSPVDRLEKLILSTFELNPTSCLGHTSRISNVHTNLYLFAFVTVSHILPTKSTFCVCVCAWKCSTN